MNNKEGLINCLNSIIVAYSNKRSIKHSLIEFFENHNISSGDTLLYWTGSHDFTMASDNILFLFSYELYNLTNETRCAIKKLNIGKTYQL